MKIRGVNVNLGFLILTIFQCSIQVSGMLEGLYCGLDNCYDVLGVTRDSSKAEISRAYRQLGKIHHPDKHRTTEAKAEAEKKFQAIATAYEVLKDEETRSDYDDMLDHPEEFYRHYYHYYRRRMSPKVDVRIVIAVAITCISAFQYYAASFRWSSGISYLTQQAKYRKMALEVAEEEGMLNGLKKIKKRNKDEIKAEEERIIRTVLESKMDIKGGYAKPKITDILWVQIILLPKTIFIYLKWYLSWIYRFNIKGEEYGEEEKLYIIRKYMKLSNTQFEAIPEEEKEEFLDSELWIKDNFKEWKSMKEEEAKRQMAESAKYKAYRRYIKKHGNGRMYFDDS